VLNIVPIFYIFVLKMKLACLSVKHRNVSQFTKG